MAIVYLGVYHALLLTPRKTSKPRDGHSKTIVLSFTTFMEASRPVLDEMGQHPSALFLPREGSLPEGRDETKVHAPRLPRNFGIPTFTARLNRKKDSALASLIENIVGYSHIVS
jgi:hypothetical protein